MKTNDQKLPAKYDYGSLFLAAILLLGASQAAESIHSPVGAFLRGVAVGISIACSLLGFLLYAESRRK